MIYRKLASMLIVFQMIFMILYGVLFEYHPLHAGISNQSNVMSEQNHEDQSLYPLFSDVHLIVLIGITFFLIFLKYYGQSAVAFCLLITSFAIQWSIISNGILRGIVSGSWPVQLNMENFFEADFSAATSLISFCCVLGVINPVQIVMMTFLEVFFYNLSNYFALQISLKDTGGTILIHIFGAYFGLGVSWVLGKFSPSTSRKEKTSYQSELLSMIGCMFLITYWPSFNACLAKGNSRFRSVFNTILSISSASCTSFAVDILLNKKLTMGNIQNGALAGGVAMGINGDLIPYPSVAVTLGFFCAIACVLGFQYVQPFLETKLGFHDSCGAHNVHALPGIIAAASSAILMLSTFKTSHVEDLLSIVPCETLQDQARAQVIGLLGVIGISSVSGLLTGLLISLPLFERMTKEEIFDDETFWKVDLKLEKEFGKDTQQTMITVSSSQF